MKAEHDVEKNTPSFSEAFCRLAYHLFPDGCPEESLESAWPMRNDRSTISHIHARQSFESLKHIGISGGFSASEMDCLAMAACATLPWKGGGSGLVDGSSKCFRDLLRLMIPKRDHQVSHFVVTKLVTVKCDDLGKAIVSRFLTLCLRSGSLAPTARQRLSSLHALLFSWLPCADTFRLVHALTRRKLVRADLAKRLRMLYDGYTQASDTPRGPIWLLLQLYARYDPAGCGKYLPSSKRNCGALSKYFQIPDQAWEQDFIRRSQTPHENTSESVDRYKNNEKAVGKNSMEWLENAFDGVHSFSLGLALGQQERRVLRASDLLMDDAIRSLLLLSNNEDGMEVVRLRVCLPYMLHEEWFHRVKPTVKRKKYINDDESSLGSEISSSDSEDERLQSEEENVVESNSKEALTGVEDQRLRILQALASMASHSSSLLHEAETFLIAEVLPFWDGSDQVGQILCHGLLPFLAPRSFSNLHNKILCHLSPLIQYGSPRVQYLIISGALASIVKRWSNNDVSGFTQTKNNPEDSNSVRLKTVRDLVEWTESQILKAMLINDGHELILECALDFFSTVVEYSPCVVLPGPSLVYQLLLSKTSVCIDYLCSLLVKYKVRLQQLKQGSEDIDEELQDSIALFNCYIWDICSALWRKSPLPSTDVLEMSAARSKSILFTDVKAETLASLHEHYESVSVALSITHGASFHSYIRAFLGQSEKMTAIEGKTKLKYLDFLKVHGLNGIHCFLTTFVASLASREERRQNKKTHEGLQF